MPVIQTNGFLRKVKTLRPFVKITGNVQKHCIIGIGLTQRSRLYIIGIGLTQRSRLYANQSIQPFCKSWKRKFCSA